MARNGFVLYHGDYDKLEMLSGEELRALFDALRQYSETGEAASMSGAVGMAFAFMRESVDRDAERYESRVKRGKTAASKRWDNASGGTDSEEKEAVSVEDPGAGTQVSEPMLTQHDACDAVPVDACDANACLGMHDDATDAISNSNPNSNPNSNCNNHGRDNLGVSGGGVGEVGTSPPPVEKPPGKEKKRFVKPTLEEVTAYCAERKNHVDPAYWMDFYVANGWRVGKNPMSDWKATVRNWERMNRKNGRPDDFVRGSPLAESGDRGDHGKPRPRIPGEVRI